MRALDAGDYAAAEEALSAAVESSPERWEVRRDLAIVQYKTGRYEEAIAGLNVVAERLPEDGRVLFYLGAALEESGHPDQALGTYRLYTRLGWLCSYRRRMEERAKVLAREMVREQIRKSLTKEMASLAAGAARSTIAVSVVQALGSEEDCEPLGAALTAWLMNDLAKIRSLRVVERLQMDVLVEELGLADTGVLDPAMLPRGGLLLGAGRVVSGSLLPLESAGLRVDLSVTNAPTAACEATASATGSMDEFFRIEKELVFRLLEGLGIEPQPREREEIERVPTRSLRATLAYGRGLIAERRRELSEARLLYEEAIEADPGFALSRQALLDLPSASVGAEEAFVPPSLSGLRSRLDSVGDLVGGEIWPEDPNDVRPAAEIATQIPEPPAPPEESR